MGSKNSVIQSTMIKITILIFCILLMLYFLIARIYWEKEVLKSEYELLSLATMVEMDVQENYQKVLSIKENQGIDHNEKIKEIDSLFKKSLEQISKSNGLSMVGYYDIYLRYNVWNSSVVPDQLYKQIDHEEASRRVTKSGLTEFISDTNVIDWDGKGIIAALVPVYYHDEIIGHTWAMISSNYKFFNAYSDFRKFFIPSIVLWIIVLILIKRSITQINISLDALTQKIIKNKIDDKADLEQLPELQPVFETIHNHLDNLQELNTTLEDTNDKLLTIMEGISDGFFSLDKYWRFTFVNEEMKRIMNKQELDLIERNIWEEIPELRDTNIAANLTYAAVQRTPMHWETQSGFLNDKFYQFNVYPFAQGLTVFFRDITEIKQREGEMIRLERLNLIGQMAAGISHEVRNPMTTVRGFLQMLEGRSDSPQNKEYMEIMISEIDRANGIITDFLSLAKANADSTKNENLNDIIDRISPMLQADAFNSNKDVIMSLEDVPELQLNESEIKQLILNLVRNGLEETPEEGKVQINTYLEDEFVILAIKDEGKGIPLEVQEKIGTPFLTTKETGTGLGLAISIGIANRHKAKFEFVTGENGTVFYIKFPLETDKIID